MGLYATLFTLFIECAFEPTKNKLRVRILGSVQVLWSHCTQKPILCFGVLKANHIVTCCFSEDISIWIQC